MGAGGKVSDKAKKCPHCGAVIEPTETTNSEIICEECGAPVPQGVNACPNCGCPIARAEENDLSDKEVREEEKEVKANNETSEISTEEKESQNDNSKPLDDNEKINIPVDSNKKKKIGIILGIIVAALAVGIGAFLGTSKMRSYSRAGKEYSAGNYEQALSLYSNLGDYKDSNIQADACIYQLAANEYAAENYESALQRYNSISEYEDATEKAKDCIYMLAEADFKTKKYQEAREKFVSIESHKDADDRANECTYILAEADYSSEKFEDALAKFNEIEGYKDAKDRATDCEYQFSVDGTFLRELAKGLVERWDQGEEDNTSGAIANEAKSMANYCDIELSHIEQFKEETFDDVNYSQEKGHGF